MKVLVVCQYFFPEQFRVNDLCFQLVKEGYQVTILTGLPNYPSGTVDKKYRLFKNRTEQINGVQVIRSSLIGRGKGKIRLALNYVSFAIFASLKALFMKKDFDVILVYQLSPVTMAYPAMLLKKMTKKPLIIYCHDLWPESITSIGISVKSKIYSTLLKVSKQIYHSADDIYTSSQLFSTYFKNTLGIQKQPTYMPLYAEALFENMKQKENQGDTFHLVFAGNIGHMQSVETLLYAANELGDYPIHFHIVGDGSAREGCEHLARSLQLTNVTFHGRYPLSEMARFYEMADAFLITLKANKVISYTLPNKVQSYMAAGKPIIGAIDGETKQVIQDANCGLCTDAENYQELASLIKMFIANKDKHQDYGRNARRYYDTYFSKQVYIRKLKLSLQKHNNGDV